MNFFLRILILSLALSWVTSAYSKNTLIQRRIAMKDSQIFYKGPYIQHTDKNGFSGEIKFQYQDNTLKADSNNFFSGYLAQFKGGWAGEINENFNWGLRLASGGWGQTSLIDSRGYVRQSDINKSQIFGGFSGSPIWLDSLHVSYFIKEDFSIRFGQMENPYFDSNRYNVIWDEDLTPSGFVFQYEKQMKDRYTFSLLGSGFVMSPLSPWTSNGLNLVNEEEVEYGLNRYMWAGSGRFKVAFDDYDFIFQTSYYNIQAQNMALDPLSQANREEVILNRVSDPEASILRYDRNFSIVDIALQMRIKNFWKPVLTSIQIVQNFSEKDEAVGVVTGGILGESQKKGAWNLGYHFFNLEQNVTMSHLTNSDIGGNGLAYSGHSIHGNYFINSSVSLGAQYILRKDKWSEEEKDHVFFVSLRARI